MNQLFTKLALFFCFSSICMASQIEFERVISPNWQSYRAIFLNFGMATCVAADQELLIDGLETEFDQEAAKYKNASDDQIFLQAVLDDEVVGYVSCQITPDLRININQLAFDMAKFDYNLAKDFLFALFEIMPQVSRINVKIPALNQDLIDLFEGLGFVNNDQLVSGLFVDYGLDVPEKCAICQVLYGPNFWEEDLDDDQVPSWLEDVNVAPDQELGGQACSDCRVEDGDELGLIE
jgi:hypothetical protein